MEFVARATAGNHHYQAAAARAWATLPPCTIAGAATPFLGTRTPLGRKTRGHRRIRPLAAQAHQRPTWLPGLDPPPYLDGTLPGDFGFDPLGLGEDPESLRWYVQAELVHCRFAMAGVAGILLTDLLRVTGIRNLPIWYEAGAIKYKLASTETLFIVQLILMGVGGYCFLLKIQTPIFNFLKFNTNSMKLIKSFKHQKFVETKRYMDFIRPGSQSQEGTFIGLEDSLEGLAPGYPGGPLFNPLGLVKDIDSDQEWKLKEIKNGRLAMVAILGIFVQAYVTHVGPIDNLIDHISNPWHRTVIQTMTGSV